MKVRGFALKSTCQYIRKHYGELMMIQIINRIPADLRHYFLDEEFNALKWYPYDLYETLNRQIVERIGGGDYTILYDCARTGAKEYFDSTLGFFIKDRTPMNVVRNVNNVFSNYFEIGKIEKVGEKDGHHYFELKNIDNKQDLFERVRGFLKGMFEITKAKFSHVSYLYDFFHRKVTFDLYWEG